MNTDVSKDSVRADRHRPTYNSESLNRAMNMAITDENFLDTSIRLLEGLKFPALKGNIVNYIKNVTNDSNVISLFQNLDGYIQFKDQYHVRKAIEENDPQKKMANQITNETRENPAHTQTAHHIRANSTKTSQAVTKSEERKDFPEVSPTTMAEFVCKKCGKSYQTPDDLAKHRRFEEGKLQERKISQKSRTDRQRTVSISPGGTQSPQVTSGESTENETLDIDTAARMANLLEGLDFPAAKEEIINHIRKNAAYVNKSSKDEITNLIQRNLKDNIEYNSVYEIEKAAELVVKSR
jgi:hypothetical protein